MRRANQYSGSCGRVRLIPWCLSGKPRGRAQSAFSSSRVSPTHILRLVKALDRFGTPLAGANSNAIVHGQNENFAIADLSSFAAAAAVFDCRDRGGDELFVDGNLKLDFAEQVHADFVAAVGANAAFLASKTLAVDHRQPHDLDAT